MAKQRQHKESSSALIKPLFGPRCAVAAQSPGSRGSSASWDAPEDRHKHCKTRQDPSLESHFPGSPLLPIYEQGAPRGQGTIAHAWPRSSGCSTPLLPPAPLAGSSSPHTRQGGGKEAANVSSDAWASQGGGGLQHRSAHAAAEHPERCLQQLMPWVSLSQQGGKSHGSSVPTTALTVAGEPTVPPG